MCPPSGPGTKDAYLQALQRDRNDHGALLGLAATYLGEGDLDAACTVAAQAATRHPDSVAAYTLLGSALLEKDHLVAARVAFLAALELDAGSRKAWAGLGVVCERSGELAAADGAWHKAFGGVEPAISTYLGTAAPVRILLLWSAVDGNISLRPILDDRIFQWSTLFVESFPSGVVLPRHDVVFNAVGNADLRTRSLDCADRILRLTAAPVINQPARVRTTGRVAVADGLRDIPDVVTPRIVAFAREALRGPHAAELIARAGFTWPLLVRSPGFHTGEHFAYVANAEALPAIVAELPGAELLVIAFIDTRSADGARRKYRVLTIDGRLYPLHLAVSTEWKVHYFRADPRPEYGAEERAFLDDMHAALGPTAIAALERIAATLGLDYAGIDFAIDAAGQVVVFEANATMAIVPPGDDAREAYRHEPVRRAIEAVRTLITRRARG
jgi:hypothetical protein